MAYDSSIVHEAFGSILCTVLNMTFPGKFTVKNHPQLSCLQPIFHFSAEYFEMWVFRNLHPREDYCGCFLGIDTETKSITPAQEKPSLPPGLISLEL
jgi:hypothetical protein